MGSLEALSNVRAFIVYRLVLKLDGKTDKIPVDPHTGRDLDAQDASVWMLPSEAIFWVTLLRTQDPAGRYGLGLMISPDIVINGMRLFALDLDSCREGAGWMPYAVSFVNRFPGAAVERSVGEHGLHVFGAYRGDAPPHGTRNKDFKMELYTRRRFIALTDAVTGSFLVDHTDALHALIRDFFPPHEDVPHGVEWTRVPVPQWHGPEDDAELLPRMLRSHSAGTVFGGRAAFADLWYGNADVLARAFPSSTGDQWDRSAADQAMFNHLAFWSGSNCDRMWRIAQQSALRREKWERADYIRSTVLRACAGATAWYSSPAVPGSAVPDPPPVVAVPDPPLNASPSPPAGTVAGTVVPPPPMVMPGSEPLPAGKRPPPGWYISLHMQQQIFAGMVYVRDMHMIQLTDGVTLGKDRFDATFAGADYAIHPDGQKPSHSAWEAYLGNQMHSFPQVHGQFFDPCKPPGEFIERDGLMYVNSYTPIEILHAPGDPSPFLNHLNKILPRGNDAQLLLYYFAAIVQNPGVKFQYAPLIQGVEGNGKTLLSHLLEYCVGKRYTHWPKAAELGSKFNAAYYGKLLICVEDVHISESKQSLWENLKPMITGTRLEIEYKGVDKVTREICCNFILNTNHKDGIRKTRNDRRIMPLFCAQQFEEDLIRDGLTKDYFKEFKRWVFNEGGPIVAYYLANLSIPSEFNPATECMRAPATTSTEEAISAGYGMAEEEILEAIAQGAEGFRNGWVSSAALDALLVRINKDKAIPRRNRRALLMSLGYVPHPSLEGGRSTVKLPDGSQPFFYIKATHPWCVSHLTGRQVADGYLMSQKLT